MEIATGQRFLRVGKDQRIVRDAIGLDFQRRRNIAHHVERRAHHLRLAAQTVWVLHAIIVGQMRGADTAPLHQFT